jgi:predicted nucleic acid-binding protein
MFLDTAYAIALSVVTDEHHAQAVAIAEQLEAQQTRLITTRAVLLEIGNALSRQRYRTAAEQLLESLEHDPQVECVSLTDGLYQQAFALFCERRDKEWGLIDCVSFIVMKEMGLTDALTTDEHFDQAGFHSLLR